MNDQAAQLRAMMAGLRRTPVAPAGPPTIVVGSGKGGVGKSVVSALLAQRMASEGHRVLLVDGSQNLGNQHVLFGVHRGATLEHLLTDAASPRDLLVSVTEQLWLLPADSGAESLHGLGALDRARLHHRLSALYSDFEVVIVDSGAGIDSVMRVCTMGATRLMLVTLPEPAALTDAYATLKIVHAQLKDLPVDVLINRVEDAREGPQAFERLSTAAERFLHRPVRYLGAIWEDDDIRRAVRAPGRVATGLGPGPNSDLLTSVLERLELPAPARTVP
ncbi:MAG TPA: AAA family ATPase [Gemmatimonadales bacterium]|nr:AAA family ATPase [Gemmatimonadales bacterium]